MAIDINYYKNYIGFNNDNSVLVSDLTNRYNQQYHEAISEFDILINSDRADTVKINGIEKKVLIDYNTTFTLSKLEKDVFTIKAYPNDIQVGAVVEMVDYTNKEKINTYLITEKESKRENYELGYMTQCNETINYWNSLSSLIHTPCISKNQTMYSLGTDETRVMTMGDSKLSIRLPSNKDTLEIARDKVFIVDGMTWKVTNVNKLNEGLIDLICSEITPRSGDDIINEIPFNEHEAIIISFPQSTLNKTVSDTFTLTPIIKKGNEIVVLSKDELNWISSNPSVATVDLQGFVTIGGTGMSTVKCSLVGNSDVNTSIIINCNILPINTTTYSIDGSDIIKKGNTYTYIGKRFLNGIETPTQFNIHLQNFIGTDSNYVNLTILPDGVSCKLKGLTTLGSFDLFYRDINDNTQTVIKNIQLKDLYGN